MLRLTDVRKSFGPTIAVDGLTLEIRPGEVFGLLGPNGAGKTTTISLAVGLLRPDSGTVEIAGWGSSTEAKVRSKIGVAPQALAIYEQLTAEENLRFFGRLYGLSGRGLGDRVTHVLNAVGLLPRKADRAHGFSGGMKRRLNLAVAMLHDPPMLLLDEPTAGVDPQSRHSILDLIRALKEQGRTVVYTTHYMEEAQRLCDRVGIMDKGKLLAIGTVNELVGRFGGKSVLTIERGEVEERHDTEDPLKEITRVLAAAEMGGGVAGDVSGVRIDRPDLESVFLSLTGRSLRD